MARKKKILVKDLLELMHENKEIVIHFYAYGIHHANTYMEGMRTVLDCKDRLNYDCMNARVGNIDFTSEYLLVNAELMH